MIDGGRAVDRVQSRHVYSHNNSGRTSQAQHSRMQFVGETFRKPVEIQGVGGADATRGRE